MRNIEKAIEAYKVKHDSRSDLTAKETYFFVERFQADGGDLLSLIYDVFRFAYWYGYQAGRRSRKGK